MAFILNQTILNKLNCSLCHKYLSVLPIKVYPDSITKCGRCSETNDNGKLSLYNKVVPNCIFKCINEYDGCNKLLSISEVVEHEKKCVGGTYNCSKCCYKFSGSALELLVHYNKVHPNSILRKSSFRVNVKQNFRERYLYLYNDKMFFILVDNLSQEKTLYLSAVSLLPLKNVTQMFYIKSYRKPQFFSRTEIKDCSSLEHFKCDNFKVVLPANSVTEVNCQLYLDFSQYTTIAAQLLIFQPPSEVKKVSTKVSTTTQTELFKDKLTSLNEEVSRSDTNNDRNVLLKENNFSSTANIQTISADNILGVQLTDEFHKEYPAYNLTPCGTALFEQNNRIDLTCSNCKQFTGCHVFDCQLNNHVVCWDCKAWCGICNTSVSGWNSKISTINELLLLPCKWQCGEHFLGTDLTQHELQCKKPKYKCSICKSQNFNLQQFRDHLVKVHKIVIMTQWNLSGYMKINKGLTSSKIYHFQNGYWFEMTFIKQLRCYEVNITSLDDISLYELAIISDGGKKYTKIVDKFEFSLDDNPKLYLKRVRNL